MTTDDKWFENMESGIPKNGVRTRFAPSPTGYMHVGGLRTALYAYLVAKKSGGTFILRIEDTDRARFVEGATEIIKQTLNGAGLVYDEGPDVGGPCAPYTQSERMDTYLPYAEKLCRTGAAYYCFCESAAQAEAEAEDKTQDDKSHYQIKDDPCRDLDYAQSQQKVSEGAPFVIRMKAPRDGETTVSDMVFGQVTTQNKTLDDMVLIKRDAMPTYNFANVIDDHLMGITHVLRGSEYISSAPKYNILYKSLGWEIPNYITVSPVMRDAKQKLSKRHGDPTYDDLLSQGYLPDAVLNYVALLGWSPGGEREIFTLPEMIDVFEISGISKAPAIFDTEKLKHFNSEYIRALSPERFAAISQPYIRQTVKNEKIDAAAISQILQARCEKLSDIPEKVDFFDALPEYDTQIYIHKKSKTDEEISKNMLNAVRPALEAIQNWTAEEIHDTFISLAQKLEVKNATLMWPVRIAISGKAVTPGGAVEICQILGKQETLSRIEKGIEKLACCLSDN